MNKERAIEQIKKLIEFTKKAREVIGTPQKDIEIVIGENQFYLSDELLQALDIAIESLEHEEKCNQAINDSAKAIAEMQELCKECKINNEWVDVRDRLPSESGMYIVTNFDNVSYTTWTTTCHYKNSFELDGVIAWKPLPQPYERKE